MLPRNLAMSTLGRAFFLNISFLFAIKKNYSSKIKKKFFFSSVVKKTYCSHKGLKFSYQYVFALRITTILCPFLVSAGRRVRARASTRARTPPHIPHTT